MMRTLYTLFFFGKQKYEWIKILILPSWYELISIIKGLIMAKVIFLDSSWRKEDNTVVHLDYQENNIYEISFQWQSVVWFTFKIDIGEGEQFTIDNWAEVVIEALTNSSENSPRLIFKDNENIEICDSLGLIDLKIVTEAATSYLQLDNKINVITTTPILLTQYIPLIDYRNISVAIHLTYDGIILASSSGSEQADIYTTSFKDTLSFSRRVSIYSMTSPFTLKDEQSFIDLITEGQKNTLLVRKINNFAWLETRDKRFQFVFSENPFYNLKQACYKLITSCDNWNRLEYNPLIQDRHLLISNLFSRFNVLINQYTSEKDMISTINHIYALKAMLKFHNVVTRLYSDLNELSSIGSLTIQN